MTNEFGTPKEHFRLFGIGVVWLIALVLLIGGISAGLWAVGVFTSDVKGAGDAIKQNNSKVNRIGKQEMFEQLVADYEGYIVKVANAKVAVKTSTGVDKELRQTELIGMVQICVDTAQQFNAESKKYTSRDWKSAGLPINLNPGECA